ncbi:hypothetical protein EVAR_56154_1 [Eumeta japonica]|uniref:Uncharacterized protein n=1 Tax=Eumeta variegata TaxID=151549 RepID=A0A4C1Y7F5_EUMVA|nr:hypothetical protein EVAR_56154_1 [Eumeta japonica]
MRNYASLTHTHSFTLPNPNVVCSAAGGRCAGAGRGGLALNGRVISLRRHCATIILYDTRSKPLAGASHDRPKALLKLRRDETRRSLKSQGARGHVAEITPLNVTTPAVPRGPSAPLTYYGRASRSDFAN